MPGTIEQLVRWENHLGTALKSAETGRADDVRGAAVAANKEMRKLMPDSGGDNVLNAMRTTHRGGLTFPAVGANDSEYIAFLCARYPWLLTGDDYESKSTWLGMLVMLGSHASAIRQLLAASGKSAGDLMQTTTGLNFRTRTSGAGALATRKKELSDATDMIAATEPTVRKAAMLPAITPDKVKIEARLRGLHDGLLLGCATDGTLHSVLGVREFPVTAADPGWPSEISIGTEKVKVPSRAFSKLAGRAEIREFGCNTSLNTTCPTRASERLIQTYTDRLLQFAMS